MTHSPETFARDLVEQCPPEELDSLWLMAVAHLPKDEQAAEIAQANPELAARARDYLARLGDVSD